MARPNFNSTPNSPVLSPSLSVMQLTPRRELRDREQRCQDWTTLRFGRSLFFAFRVSLENVLRTETKIKPDHRLETESISIDSNEKMNFHFHWIE